MSDLHLIWNPIAGSGTAKTVFSYLQKRLTALDIDFSSAMSTYAGHATLLAGEAVAAGHKKIVALGGDGTIRDVAMGMYGSDIPLAIIPCGTGNDLVRSLHIPHNPDLALDIALNGTVRSMDAAESNGELFFNIAGCGFDVDVVIATELYKRMARTGSMSYMLGTLRAMKRLKLRKTHVSWTDENGAPHEQDWNALLLAAANGTHYGGGMAVAPLADPFDGVLDVCVLHDYSKGSFLLECIPFIFGKHLRFKRVSYFRAKELTVTCEPQSRIQADGELVKKTPCTVRILPGAIRVVTPKARTKRAKDTL